MRMMLKPSLNALRRSIAMTLLLWLGGAGCMFGCTLNAHAAPTRETANSNGVPVVQEQPACPMTAGPEHCSRRAAAQEHTANSTALDSSDQRFVPNEGMNCCPLANLTSAAAAKSRIADKITAATAGQRGTTRPDVSPERFSRATPIHYPNRGQTYLRCCVFLI